MTNRILFIGIISIALAVAIGIFFYRDSKKNSSLGDPDSDWNQIGTLVYNNPGMKSDTWFLVYEEPGKPALYKELEFDSASACAIDAPAAPCDPTKIKSGSHVRVEGRIVGDSVLVRTVQLPEIYATESLTLGTTTPQTATSTSATPSKGTSSTTTATTTPSNTKSTTTPTSTPQSNVLSVKLYYYNPKLDTATSGVQCSSAGLVAVNRTIPQTNTPLQDTIKLLLRGDLTSEEKARGITTEFPLSGVTLLSASSDDGTLTLTFRDPKNRTSGGSCRVSIMWNEIATTAQQFPGIKNVRFVPETLFQP